MTHPTTTIRAWTWAYTPVAGGQSWERVEIRVELSRASSTPHLRFYRGRNLQGVRHVAFTLVLIAALRASGHPDMPLCDRGLHVSAEQAFVLEDWIQEQITAEELAATKEVA